MSDRILKKSFNTFLPSSLRPMSFLFYILFFLIYLLINCSIASADTSMFTTYNPILPTHTSIPTSGLKVVWWNIDCGLESSEQKISGHLQTTNLERNLKELSISEFKPDVLILGEYCPYSMSDTDQTLLKNTFKYNYHLERNIPQFKTASGGVNQRNGFLVLSDYRIRILKEEVLFANLNSAESKDNRKYLLFKVTKDDQDYLINPVHLVNPWRDIYKKSGLFSTFNELAYGEQNPNAIQIQNLIEKFKDNKIEGTPYLMIGDFNSPGSISGFSGWGFKQLQNNLDKLFPGHEDTYLGDGPFPATNIDHAFGYSLNAPYTMIWPLDGSRHLPLYVVIHGE